MKIANKFMCLIATALASSVVAVQASTVHSASGVISAPDVMGDYSFNSTIDLSGLSTEDRYTSGLTDYDSYVGEDRAHGMGQGTYGIALASPTFNVDYDLGANLNVEGLLFWNYPNGGSGGITAFDMFVSNNISFSGATNVGSFAPVDDGSGNLQVFDSTDAVGRYVRISATAGGTLFRNRTPMAGWSEVAFRIGDSLSATGAATPEPSALPPVPLPASAPLLIAGLGGLIALRRRCKG